MVMSHLACADQPTHEKNRTQLALFQSVMAQFPNIPASLANSAGLMTGRDYHFQMVRPGIALYGGRAVNGRRNPMAPSVTLEVPILQVKDVKTGEQVGYGATYTLNRDSRIAILALGYADGFFRHLSGTNTHPGGKAAVRGRIVPVIGRISMDLTIIDVTDLGSDVPLAGEMVEVLGPNISVDDQADVAGTIGYEILTALKGRYARQYVGEVEAQG
jgi:alanine racemase